MFNLKEWLKEGIIGGYKSGEFSRPGIITMTANYIARGMLTEADAAEIDAACPVLVAPEEPTITDEPVEDIPV
ncbi:hypothetical protein [Fumia xinanensis]|uniref:Uncharacterized protein n=1 Tax=Fumia xinanensis TaxID=2763659 RepID=A0A926E076_9FIRM|nr:hypothetical protein [Fumia xinanensis]MBC8558906.1 hypothetical protein [Fumia xinanensis]